MSKDFAALATAHPILAAETARRGAYKFRRYFPDCTQACRRGSRHKEDHVGLCRALYVKHCAFMRAGATYPERLLTNMGANEILFIDEIHRLPLAVEEVLYPALEDYEVAIVLPSEKTVTMRLERFTLIGETTRIEFLTSPRRSRFGIVLRLELYTPTELEEIVRRSAKILGIPIDDAAAGEIARQSRGTPRIANGLLRRIRDFAEVRGDGTITEAVAHTALRLLDVDECGVQQQTLLTPRELISDEVRIFVWQRDRGACVKCGTQERLEFDHIIPLAKGGSNTARNIQLLCESCNRKKGAAI